MLWSLGAKWYTYGVFEENLAAKGIEYTRLTTVPTPMNTFLWSATADGDTVLYSGLYSIFDSDKSVDFKVIKNNHELVEKYSDEEVLSRLMHISKEWYVIKNDNPDTLVYSDARFGPMYVESKPTYTFGYKLIRSHEGILEVEEKRPKADSVFMGEILNTLWNRVWGE